MEERDLAKKVIIKEIKVSNAQRVVINGVEQPNEQIVSVICCPKCGRVLMQFNSGTDDVDIIKYLSEHNTELQNDIKYCQSCGQRLSFPLIIEGQTN